MGRSKVAFPARVKIDTSGAPLRSDLDTGPSAPATTLSADVRHDVRHAAATIQLLLATIRDPSDDDARSSAYDAIAQCVRMIAVMIDDEETASAPEPVSLDSLAERATRHAALLYNGAILCETTPARVAAGAIDVARLLANLIENSCRAAGPNGTVSVFVGTSDQWCDLQVGDSGAGFVENLGRRGVGLSSIAAIAVRLGGYVSFGQSSLGGALVTVHLPLFCGADDHDGGAPT
jgi:signal transduction histidine kinase